jgi:hypothetical protein
MIVDFPGDMADFVTVDPGQLFIHFDNGVAGLAMKIFDGSSPQKKTAVLSFTTPVHASMTPPTVLEAIGFQNKSVCAVRDAIIRPSFELGTLRSDSPSSNRPGPIIFGVGATYMRAYERSGCVDVNLKTGEAEQSRAHPGSTWVENWEIVLVRKSGELVLCERGKPAAA